MAGRAPQGSVRARELADGSRMFELRFPANGRRESITLHERSDCTAVAAAAGTSGPRAAS